MPTATHGTQGVIALLARMTIVQQSLMAHHVRRARVRMVLSWWGSPIMSCASRTCSWVRLTCAAIHGEALAGLASDPLQATRQLLALVLENMARGVTLVARAAPF